MKFQCKVDIFFMALGIRETFGFTDYESGGRRRSDTDSHFGCIINLLSLINIIDFLYY